MLSAAKEFAPMLKCIKPKEKEEKDAMCEFSIKGDKDFVLKSLNLILG